jgi:hypothetical protein
MGFGGILAAILAAAAAEKAPRRAAGLGVLALAGLGRRPQWGGH